MSKFKLGSPFELRWGYIEKFQRKFQKYRKKQFIKMQIFTVRYMISIFRVSKLMWIEFLTFSMDSICIAMNHGPWLLWLIMLEWLYINFLFMTRFHCFLTNFSNDNDNSSADNTKTRTLYAEWFIWSSFQSIRCDYRKRILWWWGDTSRHLRWFFISYHESGNVKTLFKNTHRTTDFVRLRPVSLLVRVLPS